MSSEKKTMIDKALKGLYYGALPVAFTAGLAHSIAPNAGALIRAVSGGSIANPVSNPTNEPMIGSSIRQQRGRVRAPRVINDINQVIKPTREQEKLLNTMSAPNNQSGDKSSSLKYIVPVSALLSGLAYGGYKAYEPITKGIQQISRDTQLLKSIFGTVAGVGRGINPNLEQERINGKKYVIPTSVENEVQNVVENYDNVKRYIPATALIATVAGAYLGRKYIPSSVSFNVPSVRFGRNYDGELITLGTQKVYAGIQPFRRVVGFGKRQAQNLAMADYNLLPTMK